MLRKIIRYSLLSCLVLMQLSCNKWLTVNPKDQTSEASQFSTQQGFVDVLWGSYQQMTTTDSYGKNETFGLVDVLGQYYGGKTAITDYYGYAARYNYTATSPFDVQAAIQSIWKSNYATIAQANYILKDIDAKAKVFTGNNYGLVKGESYALRAFLHFDLLRLFGTSYAVNSQASAIPYMRDFTIRPQEKETVAQVVADCISDLHTARALLQWDKQLDNIASNQGSVTNDLVSIYRQNHLNYWAVNAELARIYLYAGQKDSALYYANAVINSGQFHFVDPTTIVNDPASSTADLTFSSEHIFSVYNSALKTTADAYFKSSAGTTPESEDLFSTRTVLNTIYETTTTGYGTDIRNPNASKSLWNVISANLIYTKKYWYDNASNVIEGLIPLIKLPEMYYIAAEASATPAEGVVYLNAVRSARLLPTLGTGIDDATLNSEIQKEYRKEFYAEGQLWYYFKRKNILSIPNLPSGATIDASAFVFPLPQDEIEFGL